MPDQRKKLQTPATLEGVSLRKDGSASLRFVTQEVDSKDFLTIREFYDKFGYLLFAENEIQPQDIPREDAEYGGKSPSQRLRAVLFVHYQQHVPNDIETGARPVSFEQYYRQEYEKLAEHYKSQLT